MSTVTRSRPKGRLLDQLVAGACVGSDVDFFAIDELSIRRAKLICSTCPVREVCGQYAREAGERDGVWGGIDMSQRSFKVKPGCPACSGVLLLVSATQERCVGCGGMWYA